MKLFSSIVLAICLGWTSPAATFFDDLCFTSGGAVANCLANSSPDCSITNDCLPASCKADSTSEQNSACYGPADASFPNGNDFRARSVVHADALYLLAQAVGLNARVAYFIAAYGDTPDKSGVFTLMVPGPGGGFIQYQDAQHATIALPDLFRGVNIGTGIHFPLVTNQPQITVDPTDTIHEGVSRLRSWVLGDQSGNFSNPCLGGVALLNKLTSSYFSGAQCYVSNSAFSFANGLYHVNKSRNISSYQSGDQPFQSKKPSDGILANDSPAFAGDLQSALNQSSGRLSDGITPVPLMLLQMGVYLHSLMDRISHTPALTQMTVSGQPTDLMFQAPVMFSFSHAYLHFEEVGIPTLSLRTEAALNLAYDELSAFMAKHPEFKDSTPRITVKADVVSALINSVLNQRSAAGRLTAMASQSQTFGYAFLTQASLP